MNKSLLAILLLSSITATAAPLQMPPIVVKTQVVKASQWQPRLSSTGKLVANKGIVVKPEVPGRITQILFRSGDLVKVGAPLVQLNDQSLQAQKKILQADAQLNQTNLARKQDLYAKHALSKSDLDTALALVKSDLAKIEKIDAQLKQHHITAPFAGKLGLRKVSIGDYLSPGEAIVNLQASNPIFVDFDVPESKLSQLKLNQSIQVHSPAYPTKTFNGNVMALESLIKPGSQSLTVRAKLPNSEFKLIPGTFVGVNLLLEHQAKVIMVPQTAIIYSQKGTFVYKATGDTVQKQRVTLGERTDNAVIIKSGISLFDTIVTIGNLKLYDGAKIITAPLPNPAQ